METKRRNTFSFRIYESECIAYCKTAFRLQLIAAHTRPERFVYTVKILSICMNEKKEGERQRKKEREINDKKGNKKER